MLENESLCKGVNGMDYAALWEGIAEAALNYIVVSTISNQNQKQTVTDLKTDLRTTKEDLLAELKDSRESLLYENRIATSSTLDIIKAEIKKGKNNGE